MEGPLALATLLLLCFSPASEAEAEAAAFDGRLLERTDLRFTIRVVYAGDLGGSVLHLRGNGLGLSWDASLPMESEDSGTTWTHTVVYKSNMGGYFCQDAGCNEDYVLGPGDNLEFRVSVDGAHDMIGPSYKIRMPQSEVSQYFSEGPVHTFRPWFYSVEGEMTVLPVTSANPAIGERDIVLYTPPGFKENPRPAYSVVFVFDMGPGLLGQGSAKEILDTMMTSTARDAAAVGFGDFRDGDRTDLLTPVPGWDFVCKEGTYFDNCGGCLPDNITDSGEYVWWMTEGGCGITVEVGGKGDDVLDFLAGEAFDAAAEAVDSASGGAASLSADREATAVMGYSLGGLMSCHAAWTRPDRFGHAACQSSSFWWPYNIDDTDNIYSEFHFLNQTLNTNLEDRPAQRILIDVGSDEEDDLTRMVTAARDAYAYMGSRQLFRGEDNLWLHVYPGEEHSSAAWLKRMWNAINVVVPQTPKE